MENILPNLPTFDPVDTSILDQFPDAAQSIDTTTKKNIKDSTRKQYEVNTSGKFGWFSFNEQFNQKHRIGLTAIPLLPNRHNICDFIQVLKLYFESRCIIGFVPSLDIQRVPQWKARMANCLGSS